MALQMITLIIVFSIVTNLFSMSLATPGTATFYTNYVPSACYGNRGHGVMIAAASDPLWQNGGICGKMFNVTCTGPTNPVPHPCTGKSVVVKIVDHCPGCVGTFDLSREVFVKIVDHCPGCVGTFDLSREVFSTIANPVAGIIKIDYHQI